MEENRDGVPQRAHRRATVGQKQEHYPAGDSIWTAFGYENR
jgi:hypothetical protein